MDPTTAMYTAAMEGRVDHLLHNNVFELDYTASQNGNTLLHVIALYSRATAECVNVIVKSCPLLLLRVNYKGETPLHIASREGNFEVVRQLVASAHSHEQELQTIIGGVANTKKMLRLISNNGDTALHEAIRYRHEDVVKLLVEEDPEFPHPSNKAGETPLYLAAEKGLEDSVKIILNTCSSPSYGGPGGRSALHASVIFNSEGITKELLNWYPDLLYIRDRKGWTPLHCAARFGRVERARQIVDDFCKSEAYASAQNDEKNTALHIATKQGEVGIVKCIISKFPTCAEMVNGKGQNVLHVAAENKQHEVIKFILQNPLLSTRSLINQQDNEGNTPLHLLAASGDNFSDLATHPKAEIMVFNNNNLTPYDIAYKSVEEGNTQSSHILEEWSRAGGVPCLRIGIKKVDSDHNSRNNLATNFVSRDPAINISSPNQDHRNRDGNMERLWRVIESRMIIAALIVTVTFAAGITIPGGFIGNQGPTQGLAALTRLAAFRAFVITDTIALLCSTIALTLYYMEVGDHDHSHLKQCVEAADAFTSLANFGMMIAFMTGTYAVLVNSLALAITIIILCSCFYIYFSFLFHNRYGISVFTFFRGKVLRPILILCLDGGQHERFIDRLGGEPVIRWLL